MNAKLFFPLLLSLLVLPAALPIGPDTSADLDSRIAAPITALHPTLGPAPCIAAESGPDDVVHYIGMLSARTERVGTKSEGPEYYLRLKDGAEIHVVKNATLWEADPALQALIDRKVWIEGKLAGGQLYYTQVKPAYGQ
jgi:hypothetical protein